MAASRFQALACATITACILLAVAPSTAEYPVYAETSFIHRWQGEFIGVVEIPLEEDINGWNMTITFPRNIFEFEACAAEFDILDDKRTIYLTNTSWNAEHSEGESVYFTFNARVWKKIKGLTGDIEFWANVVEDDGGEGSSSSSSVDEGSSSAMGFDNGLDACNETLTDPGISTNNTCGSVFELLDTGAVTVAEVYIPVDLSTTDSTTMLLSSSESLAWFAIDVNFQMIFTTSNGTVIPVDAALSVKNQQERTLTFEMTNELSGKAGVFEVRFRYPGSASANVLFPYIKGTPICPCRRLEVIMEEMDES